MVKSNRADKGKERDVACTHCGEPVRVATRAMSIFCPHCKQRLILEDYRIRAYQASRLFATCGDIVVEESGFVSAPIRVANLTVRGRIQGDIDARGVVSVSATGRIRGDVRASRLKVAAGATLDGFFRIAPDAVSLTS